MHKRLEVVLLRSFYFGDSLFLGPFTRRSVEANGDCAGLSAAPSTTLPTSAKETSLPTGTPEGICEVTALFPLDPVRLPSESGAVAFGALAGDSLFPKTFTLTILSPQAPSSGSAEHSIFVPLQFCSTRQDHAPRIYKRPHNSFRPFGCQKPKAVPRCKRDNSQEVESQEEHSSVNVLSMSSGHRCGGELQNQLAVLSEQITRHDF